MVVQLYQPQPRDKEQHIMKYMKIAGLCLVALLLMSMAMTASASAAPVWQVCEKGASGTKYEATHEECEEASGTGEWGWSEIKGTEKSIAQGTVTLKDESVVTVEVGCYVREEGSIGPGKYSRIEKATYECTAGKNCEKLEKVEAKNLPWQEEMFETEKTIEGKISNGKSEKEGPDLAASCTVLGVKTTDEANMEKTAELLDGRRTIRGRFEWFELLELITDRPPDNGLDRNGSVGDLLIAAPAIRAR
jgi:hypothetical protein